MPYDSGLVARVADTLATLGERAIRQKNVFSGRGFMTGGSAFVIVWGESLLVKASVAEHEALLREPGVTPFRPGGATRAMGTWLVVPADTIADDPELQDWVQRGLRGVR